MGEDGRMLKPPRGQRAPVQSDNYAVASLTAALASLGFVVGPALFLGFAWALAMVALVLGLRSSGGAMAAVGAMIGGLVALAAIVVAAGL